MRRTAIAVCALIIGATAAHARCGPTDLMRLMITEKHKESLTDVAHVTEQVVVEIYRNSNGGWTILQTRTDGFSCLIAAGEDWSHIGAPRFVGLEF